MSRKMVDVIVRTHRGISNECFGFCVGCPQSEITMRTTEDADVVYFRCELPSLHTIRFKRK